MKKCLSLLIFLSLAICLSAQFPATFADSSFSFSPFWQGDTLLFQIRQGRMQLVHPQANSRNDSYLSVLAPTDASRPTSWSFNFFLDFSPSSSNFADIYLTASNPDLTGPLNGYFLRTGGIAGSDDALTLYRQSGTTRTPLASGTIGALGTGPLSVRVRVDRDTLGNWTVRADYTSGNTLTLEATVQDPTFPKGQFAGWRCQYTATRGEAFAFDEVDIQPLIRDTLPPQLLLAEAQSEDSVLLTFSEPLRPNNWSSADFQISEGPSVEQVIAVQPTQLLVVLASELENNRTYSITVRNVSDLAGNEQGLTQTTFTFLTGRIPEPGQLVLTEFLANPSSDLLGIPAEEFVEIYNASPDFLDLSAVRISSGGNPVNLPDDILPPGSYRILTAPDQATAFADWGTVLPVPGMPGLSNGGDVITLQTANGALLEQLTYNTEWYNTPEAADGRATLERIQITLPADCPGNWQGSPAADAGTPGQPNAVGPEDLENDPPDLFSVRPLSTMEVLVVFSETVDQELAEAVPTYALNNNLTVNTVLPTEEGYLLLLDQELNTGTRYQLTIAQMRDCLGNENSVPLNARFGLPEAPESGDLLINEVLFHPQSGGEDFLELVNASDKILELSGLAIRNRLKETGNIQTVIEAGFLLFPGEYLAITDDPEDIRSRYPLPDTARLFPNDLPTLDADAGNVSLFWGNTLIDAFDYDEDLHNALLDNERGVSLERLSLGLPTQSAGNWHSAAEASGFATPGYPNSQMRELMVRDNDIFTLSQRTFSPDGDGFEDLLLLDYQTDRPGYLANIRIFDAEGRTVRTLARNELLATDGRILWDGSRDDRERSRTGLYVIWIELFTPEGDKTVIREYCVLASRFD